MRVQHVSPILNVSDLEISFAWFAKLGWQKDWDYGDPPDFGSVCNGNHDIFLCRNGQGVSGAWIYIRLESPAAVDALYARGLASGLTIEDAPADAPWNSREMLVRHPDGHMLRIGAPIEKPGVSD